MSVIIVKYTQIECDGCGLQSGPEYGVSEIDVEARALIYGWKSLTPGSPLMSEAKHLCPACAKGD